jgi:hypothetical protein
MIGLTHNYPMEPLDTPIIMWGPRWCVITCKFPFVPHRYGDAIVTYAPDLGTVTTSVLREHHVTSAWNDSVACVMNC